MNFIAPFLPFFLGGMFGASAICAVQRYVQRIYDWRVSAVWALMSAGLAVFVALR